MAKDGLVVYQGGRLRACARGRSESNRTAKLGTNPAAR